MAQSRTSSDALTKVRRERVAKPRKSVAEGGLEFRDKAASRQKIETVRSTSPAKEACVVETDGRLFRARARRPGLSSGLKVV